MSERQPTASEAGGTLGVGGVFRLVWRTVPYLRQGLRDLGRLVLLALPVLAVGFVVGVLVYDLGINRLLLAKPLTPFEAKLLGFDPAQFVHVESLGVPARQALRMRLVVFTLLLVAILGPLGVAVYLYFIRVLQRINQGLRVHMVQQVQAMSMRFHSGSPIGDAIYRTYQDSAMVTNLILKLLLAVGRLVLGVLTVLALFAFAPRIGGSLLLMGLLSLAIARYFSPELRTRFRIAREQNSALTSRIQETLAAIKVVKAFGTERFEQTRFEQSSEAAFAASFRARVHLLTYNVLCFIWTALPTMAAGAYMAVWAAEGKALAAGAAMAAGGFAAWNLGAYSFALGRARNSSRHTSELLKTWGELQNAVVGMSRAFAHVDLEPEVTDRPDAVPLQGLREQIALHGVTFGYEPDHPVLRDIDLTARAGEITALVGPTGSGKSTLVSLLLRLFDPDRGHIEIDGRDLREYTLESLRGSVAIALQENLLFGTTVRENIRYASPEASEEDVRAAARIACAEGFIDALPAGFDTALGERGSKLSTGQRQRLSIARAVVKDTPVLILDEPTASLDAETEVHVLENLAQWGRGRAIFLITHRLSTIRRADKIVYLRDGQIVEVGSHAELMAKAGGAYRRFVELEREAEPLPPQRVLGASA